MNFDALIGLIGSQPVFTTGMLKIPGVNDEEITLQLVRWGKAGRLIQLRRGVYALSAKYRKMEPHSFLVAQTLNRASYVSLQSALAWHGLIPEHVPEVTSVTLGRPERIKTPLGAFQFRHLKPGLFVGYSQIEATTGQQAVVASPEKAVVDLFYLTPASDGDGFVEELRLQNTEKLERDRLTKWALLTGNGKTRRAVERLCLALEKERFS